MVRHHPPPENLELWQTALAWGTLARGARRQSEPAPADTDLIAAIRQRLHPGRKPDRSPQSGTHDRTGGPK